jgi:hypothetical protein
VRLRGVTHTHLDDLDIMLVSPHGHRAMVLSNAGGTGVTGANLFFNRQCVEPGSGQFGARERRVPPDQGGG